MITYAKAAELVVSGYDKCSLQSQSCPYKREEKQKIERMLRVEKEVFRVYLQTGHFSIKRFDFNLLKPFNYDSSSLMQKLAFQLLKAGWNPALHAKKTREYYRTVSHIERYDFKNRRQSQQSRLN